MIFLLILHFIHSWSILSCTKVSFCCSEIKKSQTNFMWNTLAGIKHCDALNCFISVDSLNEKNCCWETFAEKRSCRWSQTVLLGLINLPVKTCPSLCVDCHCGAKPSTSIIKPGIRCMNISHQIWSLYFKFLHF